MVVRLSGVPVHVLIFFSAIVSTVILSFAVPLRKYRSQIPRGKDFIKLLVLGPILLGNTATFFYAYRHTTISNAILTHYIAPVLVAMAAPVFLKEAVSKRVILSIVFASVGLWLLIGSPGRILSGLGEPGSDAMGIISGLCSGVMYAVLIIVVRAFSLRLHPVPMCYFQNLAIILLLLPFIKSIPWEEFWGFLVVGVMHSTVAPILYFKGMQMVKANRAAVLGYIEPIGAIIFGMAFLGEFPEAVSILGGGLILYSGYLALTGDNET